MSKINESTVARIAGNIAGNYVNADFTNSDEKIAEWSVALARAIVAEVERTESKAEDTRT